MHMNSSLNFGTLLGIFSTRMNKTQGHMFGTNTISSLLKLTWLKSTIWTYHWILDGSGHHVVSWNTNSFTGCFSYGLNTRAMLLKRSFFIPSYECVPCGEMQPETRDHLFFHCPFAKACCTYLCPDYVPLPNVHANVNQLKQNLKVPFHMETTILAAWSIWKRRNEFIFNGRTPSLYRCRQIFKKKLNLVFHRAERTYEIYHILPNYLVFCHLAPEL